MKYFLITYKTKANGQIDEEVQLTRRLKPDDLRVCNVIMNFAEKKVERCCIEGKVLDTDWERLYGYYSTIYPKLIQQLEAGN